MRHSEPVAGLGTPGEDALVASTWLDDRRENVDEDPELPLFGRGEPRDEHLGDAVAKNRGDRDMDVHNMREERGHGIANGAERQQESSQNVQCGPSPTTTMEIERYKGINMQRAAQC